MPPVALPPTDLLVGDRRYRIYRVPDLEGSQRLPMTHKILLEQALRRRDGAAVHHLLKGVSEYPNNATVPFHPSRVLLQDSTGIPVLVDLAALRDAVAAAGGDVAATAPKVPTDLVVDHSLVAEFTQSSTAIDANVALEYERNLERYAFLRWNEQASERLRVVPPNTGIVHQVNLEHLAPVVTTAQDEDGRPPVACWDTLVGTDSHTTMVNALGVVGWGVGGIEAEAAIIGQPLSIPIPEVVGVHVRGSLADGVTATDLVLSLAQLLRSVGVVGSVLEFYGEGLAGLSLETRATIANMAPEYGSTMALFPVDRETLRYLRRTGRPEHQVQLVEAYARAQGLFGEGSTQVDRPRTVAFDLTSVEPTVAGPARPHDRTPLQNVPQRVARALEADRSRANVAAAPQAEIGADHVDGSAMELADGHVVIAAITSCTNTSNPALMLGAGLLARRAVRRGLATRPWVKTSLAPGSRTVVDYLAAAGLLPELEQLGFHVVGFGCTTCAGRSGSLLPAVADAVRSRDLAVAAVLSGNRNFDSRIHPDCRLSFLASPPLVVAYALAGTMTVNLRDEPLGRDRGGRPVYLRDLWPSDEEIQELARTHITSAVYATNNATMFVGDQRWRDLEVPAAGKGAFAWDATSATIRRPPFLENLEREARPPPDVRGAHALLALGDDVTTDHISPTGRIPPGSPAGRHLADHGVATPDMGTFSSRRGNHEVMVRGTFTNTRLENALVAGQPGGTTRHVPSGDRMSVFQASQQYADEGVELVIVAGTGYGAGSSRDWAAKGTALLGVRAVLAVSFERIHRANLVCMGVLPIQLPLAWSELGLQGTETFDIEGVAAAVTAARKGRRPARVEVTVTGNGIRTTFEADVRVDTPQEAMYLQHGGILPYTWRRLVPDT